jgi:hypothetical protein
MINNILVHRYIIDSIAKSIYAATGFIKNGEGLKVNQYSPNRANSTGVNINRQNI